MVCCNNTCFTALDNYFNTSPTNKIEINTKAFIEYSLLQMGAFANVAGSAGTLKCVCAPGYDDGQVWSAIRGGIIWETVDLPSINHSTVAPSFNPAPSNINYDRGWVIYDGALATDATVTGSYSMRMVDVLIGGECPWWKEFESSSWDVENWILPKDETCVQIAEQTVNLPVIVINTVAGNEIPRGLGGCKSKQMTMDLHVFSRKKEERDKIMDILLSGTSCCVGLYDPDLAPCVYDCNGFLENPLTYLDLLENFSWKGARLQNTSSFGTSLIECGIWEGIVRWNWEIYL